ncbi:MAG: hypothetical protein AVDCRST_MAG66-3258, partial [uncultured Pseudonocardia sp.]
EGPGRRPPPGRAGAPRRPHAGAAGPRRAPGHHRADADPPPVL